MSSTIALGPLALPVSLLVLLVALAIGWWAGTQLGRRRGVASLETALYVLLGTGLLAARLAFVLQYRDAYLAAPWTIADIRDGGWSIAAGLIGAGVAAALAMAWRKALGKPLFAALGSAVAVWLAGTFVIGALVPQQGTLPALALPSLAGPPVELAQFKGKPIVVNLWATWCPPCRREMPVLQRAQQQRPDVHFVFLNQGEEANRVSSFLSANGIVLRNVLLDRTGQAGVQLGHRALPTTLFFDARGQLVDTRVGELSSATLAERLEALAPTPTAQE